MRLLDIDPKWPVINLTLPIAHADCFSQPLCSRVFNKGDVIEGQSMLVLTFPIGWPTAYVERTALRWPKIPLASASLRCEVRTVGTSSMPKSFAATTCAWFGLQGNGCDDSHLVGVLR